MEEEEECEKVKHIDFPLLVLGNQSSQCWWIQEAKERPQICQCWWLLLLKCSKRLLLMKCSRSPFNIRFRVKRIMQ